MLSEAHSGNVSGAAHCMPQTGNAMSKIYVQSLRLILVATIWPSAALASERLIPYFSTEAEYNSNVFALPNSTAAFNQNGDRTLDDTVVRTIGGIEAAVPLGQQKLRAIAEGRHVDFSHFGRLDHNEYLFSGGLDWRLTQALDGALDYRQEQRMASFADRNTTDLTLENERVGSGSLRLSITPEWRLETGFRSRELSSPLPEFPKLKLNENSVTAGINYLGNGKLTTGVYTEYLSGQFEGLPDASGFSETTIGVRSNYAVSEISLLGAQLGYTRRQDELQNGNKPAIQSGITGALSYRREITAKTSGSVQIFRRVRSDIRGAGSVGEVGLSTNLKWQGTPKTSLEISYEFTQSKFQSTTTTSSTPGQQETNQLLSLKINYQMLPWLAVRPYAGYQERDSASSINNFQTSIVGIGLHFRFR